MSTELTIKQDALRIMSEGTYNGLEHLLETMCKFGSPRVSKTTSGWYCSCDMHTATAGTSFEVKSEFNNATPLKAAQQCAQRIVEVLKKLV